MKTTLSRNAREGKYCGKYFGSHFRHWFSIRWLMLRRANIGKFYEKYSCRARRMTCK